MFFTIDKVLFLLYFAAVAYLFFFACASNLKREARHSKAKKEFRFAVLLFWEHTGDTINEAINSFLYQEYPSDKFNLVVIYNPRSEPLLPLLDGASVMTIATGSNDLNKAEAVKFAMRVLPDEDYDVALIMNDNNIVTVDFLREINNAYYVDGSAIQTHRTARSIETDTALFGAVSEEINNSIFRKGHVCVGLSSGLIGSGMAFSFSWLKKNIADATNADLEKQLEVKLLEQFVFVDYLNDVIFYEEKAAKADEFYHQRNAWLTNQMESVKIMISKLPVAVVKGNYDYCNKIIQWLLPSRIILLGVLVMISLLLLLLSWGMAIKWILLLLLLTVAFSMALPDHYIDARFIKALRSAPLLFLVTVFDLVKKKIKPIKIKLRSQENRRQIV